MSAPSLPKSNNSILANNHPSGFHLAPVMARAISKCTSTKLLTNRNHSVSPSPLFENPWVLLTFSTRDATQKTRPFVAFVSFPKKQGSTEYPNTRSALIPPAVLSMAASKLSNPSLTIVSILTRSNTLSIERIYLC